MLAASTSTGAAGGGGDAVAHQLGQLADGQVHARPDVDGGSPVVVQQQVQAGIGQVVDVQEFTECRPSTPQGNRRVTELFGFVEFADQRWQHVRIGEIIIIARPVQIGGHR